MPVLTNLFGTPARVARAMGVPTCTAIRAWASCWPHSKSPRPPKGLKDMLGRGQLLKTLWNMAPTPWPQRALPARGGKGPTSICRLPVQHCWPATWPAHHLGPHHHARAAKRPRQNLGIYRQQVLSRNQVIMRWLAHRGGALDFADHCAQHPGQPYPWRWPGGRPGHRCWAPSRPCPTACRIPVRRPAARCPHRSGRCLGVPLQVPATAEIVLEGHIQPDAHHASGWQHALEGPYGDHTGYYNECAEFPVFTVDRITMRSDAIYHSTYTGKPPDEPAVLGLALNELFIPLLQKQFPEIVDFYLPPEGCSYRMAAGGQHPQGLRRPRAARDDGRVEPPAPVHVHQVHRGGGRRRGRARLEGSDLGHHHPHGPGARHHDGGTHAHRLPGLASPVSGLGSKMGMDATNKWPGETQREWGTTALGGLIWRGQ